MLLESYVDLFQLFLFVTLGFLVFLPLLPNTSTLWRRVVLGTVIAVSTYYLGWRIIFTVLPVDSNSLYGFWVWFCFSIEFLGWIENSIFMLLMSRYRDNKPIADNGEEKLRSVKPEQLPSVDIYIPTYNEGLDVLERTILGALYVDWPKDKVNVYVLDDGKRDWLKEYCEAKNVGYITRPNNIGAKAGNINNALPLTNGDLVAFCDADFVMHRNFLYRTIGFFFDPRIAIVQTPHTFFNHDFVQTNMGLHNHIPDDQRLFYDIIMPSRDAWDTAFFCGTAAIGRRKLLVHHGALSFDSITEDILLSVKLLTKGYVTRYLNEPLCHGLATESIDAYAIQRQRWARGGVQLLYAEHGIFNPQLPFIKKLFFLPLHWIIHPIIRLMILFVPIIYFFFDAPPFIVGSYVDIIRYQLPVFAASYLATIWLGPWRWIPILTTAYENVSAINMLPTVLHSLVRPYGTPFKVTPKGAGSKQRQYHPISLYITLTLLGLTVIGILLNSMPQFQVVSQEGFFPVSVAWAFMNIAILVLMAMMSIERPRYRTEERFDVNMPIDVRFDLEHKHIAGHMVDISVTGTQVIIPNSEDLTTGNTVYVSFDHFKDYPGHVVSRLKDHIHIAFDHPEVTIRENLIQHVYTGKYKNLWQEGHTDTFFSKIWQRLSGNHDHLKKYFKK